MRLDWTTMWAWGRELLEASGMSGPAASAVMDSLEYAERRGFASHGYMRLPIYASRVAAGGINGAATVRVVSDQPALTIVDADAAAGAYSANACVQLAVRKAHESGAAVVLARNANHFGAAGFFTNAMATAGVFGIVACNTDPWMCAPFGGRPVLGTNPISMAAPLVDKLGPQLDMATTEGNYGKIAAARDRGEPIPAGWAVDIEGNPTTDAARGLAGALLPTGGPRGFGLAVMVDCLLAIGGARTSDIAGPLYGDPSAPQELGHVFIAIRVDQGQTAAEYAARVTALTESVHASGIPGSARPPMVPGEPERARLAASSAWEADATTLAALAELSLELGVAAPTGA